MNATLENKKKSQTLTFTMAGLLADAQFQCGRLTGEQLEVYCRTFSALALTAVEQAVEQGILPAEWNAAFRIPTPI